jgi:hypothetical protein
LSLDRLRAALSKGESSNHHRWFESWPLRQRGRELFLSGSRLAKKARIVGTFAHETDPEPTTCRASFLEIRAFFPHFLRRLIVEWLFAMHAEQCRWRCNAWLSLRDAKDRRRLA